MFGWLRRWALRRAVREWLERLEERGMLKFLKGVFGGSKKLTSVLAGLLVVVFREGLGLDDETARSLIELIMTYIVGQSGVDLALAFKGAKTE